MNTQCLKHGHVWQRHGDYTRCTREDCNVVRIASPEGGHQPICCDRPANLRPCDAVAEMTHKIS